ncbi:MAG: aminotransferase class I/II-fold pyridoxal phosphate-dependent enzyme [Clostridia bacterium]
MNKRLTSEEKTAILATERERLARYKAMGLKLDMSRGKPCSEQLDLSMGLFDQITSNTEIKGVQDYRNYGITDGIPELKRIFQELINVDENELIVAGNSSLNLMYDTLQRAMQFGVCGGEPFNKQGKIKWLCPVPGYDRHFSVTEVFGIEMINVPINPEGVDMDEVERLVKDDDTIKGMWCVPKYSNPQGIVYSENTVKRLAALKPKAKDFRIYWDDAYMVHTLTDEGDTLTDILAEAKKLGNEDIVYMFGSTSKITFAGAGVAFIAGSAKNISEIKARMFIQTIGPNKINQLAHALFLKDTKNIAALMRAHKDILKPKFDAVIEILEEELSGLASWINPRGGYFISCELPSGTAAKTVALAKDAGVIFTPAGSTYPYKKDPSDSNLRIAPTLPPIDELKTAMRVFCAAAKIAYLEKELT